MKRPALNPVKISGNPTAVIVSNEHKTPPKELDTPPKALTPPLKVETSPDVAGPGRKEHSPYYKNIQTYNGKGIIRK